MQRSKIKSKFCRECGKQTKHECHHTALGCGDLLLTILTIGAWILLRWLFAPGFRCTNCGQRN